MSQLRKWVVVCALIFAIGGQWPLLQSVAWASMVCKYSQEGSIKEAIAKTFDGKHPCQLCLVVEHGKKAEKKQQAGKQLSKTDFFTEQKTPMLCPPDRDGPAAHPSPSPDLVPEAPPLPPPRAA